MMAVIMQKCDDTHNVATDDRTTLPSERGAVLFLFAYLNRIIRPFGFTFNFCDKCVCLSGSHYQSISRWPDDRTL